MKKILSLIIIMSSFGLCAQQEASNWYFGENAGIRFDATAGTVTAVTDGQLNTREGCSSISDANGNLLFYSDGSQVWNRNHVIMQNGTGLFGNDSSTQSAIIVAKPSDPNVYYIFTVDTPFPSGTVNTGLTFSEVNMTLDGGLGAVTIKNTTLLSNCSEKISAVLKDCVTKSLWVISFGSLAGTGDLFNTYHAFEVTAAGVNTTAVTSSFPLSVQDRRGYLKLSPDGTKMASANMGGETGFGTGAAAEKSLLLYDFDVTTGIVSNQVELRINGAEDRAYGIEFSPSNELLYVHSSNDFGGNGSNNPSNHSSKLTQFDITAPDIQATELVLDDRQLYRGGLQLGPDGRIYRALSATYNTGLPFLGVINNPNTLGAGANYQHNAISLNGRNSTQGLPPFDQSLFNTTIDIIQNPTIISTTNLDLCNGDTYTLVAPDIPGAVYTWTKDGLVVDDGDLVFFEYEVTQTGQYEVLVEPDPLDCGDNLVGVAFVNYFDNPTATQVPPMRVCDDNNDGLWLFDLTDQEAVILNGQDPLIFEVKYFESQADANANMSEIIGLHENNGNPQEIFVRVQNIGNPNCFDDSVSFFIEVFDTPIAERIIEISECDDDIDLDNTNGQREIDLTALIPDVLGTQNPADFTVTFHIDQTDADTGNAPLASPYYNVTPFQQTIYVRIENTNNTSCFDTDSFMYIVDPIPASFNTTLTQCDEDGTVDGLTFFNLTEANEILTGGVAGLTTSFYLDPLDAENETSPENEINFGNTANPQTLYVRVEDDATECFSVTELILDVSITDIDDTQLFECDDDGIEDGFHEFTLSDADAAVLAGTPAATGVIYYETYNDALLEENPITSPTFTNNQVDSQIIFARAENANACYGISEVTLTVNPLPDIEIEEEAIYCLNTFPTTITLTAGLNQGIPSDYSYLWSTGEITHDIQVNATGTYTVTVTDGNTCSKERTITVLPSNIATITDIEIVDATSNNMISVLVTGEGDYEFALDSASGPYQDSNIFEDVRPGLHTVYVRDKNNCGVVDDVVSVIGFPKFITPNNDGKNDTWQVLGIAGQFQPNSRILIHDRYGKLVKQLNPLGNGWDGTFNGKLLPSDDYWFAVFLEDGRIFKSHFALKR